MEANERYIYNPDSEEASKEAARRLYCDMTICRIRTIARRTLRSEEQIRQWIAEGNWQQQRDAWQAKRYHRLLRGIQNNEASTVEFMRLIGKLKKAIRHAIADAQSPQDYKKLVEALQLALEVDMKARKELQSKL